MRRASAASYIDQFSRDMNGHVLNVHDPSGLAISPLRVDPELDTADFHLVERTTVGFQECSMH